MWNSLFHDLPKNIVQKCWPTAAVTLCGDGKLLTYDLFWCVIVSFIFLMPRLLGKQAITTLYRFFLRITVFLGNGGTVSCCLFILSPTPVSKKVNLV